MGWGGWVGVVGVVGWEVEFGVVVIVVGGWG